MKSNMVRKNNGTLIRLLICLIELASSRSHKFPFGNFRGNIHLRRVDCDLLHAPSCGAFLLRLLRYKSRSSIINKFGLIRKIGRKMEKRERSEKPYEGTTHAEHDKKDQRVLEVCGCIVVIVRYTTNNGEIPANKIL